MLIETQLPNLLHRGKVRDTYKLGEGLLLMISTDRNLRFRPGASFCHTK